MAMAVRKSTLAASGILQTQIDETRAFFNKPRRTDPVENSSPSQKFVYAEIAKRLPVGRGNQTAVDLGCHWGRFCRFMAGSYGRVVGIDFAQQALETAIPSPRIEYRCGDLEKSPELLASFSPVHFYLAVGLFEMLQNPERLLENMRKYASSGGRLAIVIPNPKSINFSFLRILLWLRKHLAKTPTGGIFHNHLSPEMLRVMVLRAGFAVDRFDYFVGTPIYMFDRLPRPIQSVILRCDALFFRIFGGSYCYIQARVE